MQQDYKPVTMLELHYWVQASKEMTKENVEKLQNFLRQRALDCGCEEGVSLAMNTIVGFDDTDAKVFQDKEDAIQLCEKLNEDKEGLLKNGYEAFSIQIN